MGSSVNYLGCCKDSNYTDILNGLPLPGQARDKLGGSDTAGEARN